MSWNRIVSALAEGIAPQYPLGREKKAFERAVFLESVQCIMGASRIESAAGRKQRRNTNLIEANQKAADFCQNFFHGYSIHD